jgi:tetratricopeptide (TPR) repeat protein
VLLEDALLSEPGSDELLALKVLISWLRGGKTADPSSTPLNQPDAASSSPSVGGKLPPEFFLYTAWQMASDGAGSDAANQLRSGIAVSPTPELYVALLQLLGEAGLSAFPLGLQPAALAPDGTSVELERERRLTWEALMEQYPEHPAALRADADRLFAQALASHEAGRYSVAEQAYAHALRSTPAALPLERAALLGQAGRCQALLGRYNEAAASYREALKLRYRAELVADLAAAVEAQERKNDPEHKFNDDAAVLWKDYLTAHSDDARIWLEYGRFWEARGEHEFAAEQFGSALYVDPELADAHALLALNLQARGLSKEAEQHLRAALGRDAPVWVYSRLAELLRSQGRDPEAEQVYVQAHERFPQDRALLLNYARLLVSLRRSDEAFTLLSGLLDTLPGDEPELLLELGAIAAERGDFSLAESLYQRGMDRLPGDYRLQSAAAVLMAKQGRDEDLFKFVATAQSVLQQRDFAALVDQLALYWIERRDYTRGRAFMDRLIESFPQEPSAYSELALLLSAEGRFAEALSAVQRGLNDAGDNYLGRYLEAYLTYRLTSSQDALPLARALLKRPELDANGHVLYLRLIEERGDYAEQAQSARDGLQRFPGHPGIFGYLARGLYFSGDTPAVIDLLEDPAFAAVNYAKRKEMLGSAYLDEGNSTRAAALLQDALRETEPSPRLLSELGQAYYALRDFPQARSYCQAALQADAECIPALLWLGYTFEAMAEPLAASDYFGLVEKSPLASKEELAWCALGQARVALAQGDKTSAATRLSQAEAFGLYTPHFISELNNTLYSAGLESR